MTPSDVNNIGTGVIAMWAGVKNNIPAGWHECDGSLLSQDQYSILYGIIGKSFGASPPEGEFYLPDLRGQFVRGVDDNSGTDPDIASRTDMQDPSVTYSGVGSVQACALQTHTHSYTEVASADSGTIDNAKAYQTQSANTGSPQSANVSQYETRPVNAYLYYIIKL